MFGADWRRSFVTYGFGLTAEIESVRACRSILMVGTHPRTMGGVATVVRGYLDGGLFERFECNYVVSHRDGGALTKAGAALSGWLRTLWLLMRMPAPLVHIHLSSRASFWRKSIVCLLALMMRRPYLLHVHGSEFMKFFTEECGPAAQGFVRFIFRKAGLVLALSEQWRSDLLRICPTATIEVLPNAVAVPDAAVVAEDDTSELRVLFLGRLGRRKGTFDLVHAFARIAARFPQARLICAGDGAIDEVMTLTRDLQIGGRVLCPGWLNVESARIELNRATMFVLPSYAEGLPMALLEAMAVGLPVVTSPVGGIPEVVEDGVNGLLVGPGDMDGLAQALARMLADTELRHRFGANARATILRRFSLAASLDRLASIYARFGISERASDPLRSTS